jgi:hypothetical protein
MSGTNEYIITAADIDPLRCKVIGSTVLIDSTALFSFGADMCQPNRARIYKIEYNQSCINKDGLIDDNNIRKLVMLSMWTLKMLFSEITRFELIGRAHIYCGEDVRFSLDCEYVLRYGKTWDEKLFGAVLNNTLYDEYNASLFVLDQLPDPYEYMLLRLPDISVEEAEYRAATSPRDFIGKLRAKYGVDYFYKVGLLLKRYFRMLHIWFYSEMWYIDVSSLIEIDGYVISESVVTDAAVNCIPKQYSLVIGCDEVSCVGYYGSFE